MIARAKGTQLAEKQEEAGYALGVDYEVSSSW